MITLNGRAAEEKGMLLETCRVAGVDVPAFCYEGRLSVGGHCRSCLVEVDGRYVAACSTPALDGMSVLTDSAALEAYRRDLGELMLAESAPHGSVIAQLSAWGVAGTRYAVRRGATPVDASHPYLRIDLTRCILCRLCERACAEVQGQFVYAFEGRGIESHLGWGGGTFAGTDCVSCGECVAVCPSAALIEIANPRLPVLCARPAATAASGASLRFMWTRIASRESTALKTPSSTAVICA